MHEVAKVGVAGTGILGTHEAWGAVQLPRTLHVRGRIDPTEVRGKD